MSNSPDFDISKLPMFLRFSLIRQQLGVDRWLAERIIKDAKVPTHQTTPVRGAVLVARDPFIAALRSLPGARWAEPPPPPVRRGRRSKSAPKDATVA
jgi:hypothetical protein